MAVFDTYTQGTPNWVELSTPDQRGAAEFYGALFGWQMVENPLEDGHVYIVGNLQKERIKSILDLTISRFNAFARLQGELDRTKSALEERKVIDRAKGILMKMKGLTEDEAYVLLRSTAMREKKRIGEIAQSIITASEMLK